MSDQENQNQGEEEYEEENMMNFNPNENENQEEEDGQDVYAFDIQINEDSYLLVIGKTEENKILLRLIDKEDQNKPFYQNEFSLEDLRTINSIFENIDNEDIAFQYLASNLNDAEKEIKIIDDSKIKFIIYITDEDEKFKIDFLLFKTIDEAMNEGEEGMIEEGGNKEDNNNMINNEIEDKKEEKREEELHLDMGGISKNQIVEKKEDANVKVNEQEIIKSISTPKEEKENKDNKLMKEELLNIINTMNETLENKILVQNEAFNKMKEELQKENDLKIQFLKEELNNKNNEIITLKNTITNLEQKLNTYEGKIDDMNNKLVNLENLNINLNNKNIESEENKIDINIVNELKGNLNLVDNKIDVLKKEYESDKNNNDNNIQILNEKISNLDNKIQLNNKQKEETTEENKKIIDLDNKLQILENKINNYELDQIIENLAILTEKQNDTKVYETINYLGNELNELKQKVDKQEKDINRASFSKKENTKNDTEIINKINNLEMLISTIQSQLKTIQEEKNSTNLTNANTENVLTELINTINDSNSKIDSLFNITQKLSKENNDLNSKINNIMSDISKLSTKITINPKISNQEKIISRANYHRPIDNQDHNNPISYYNKTTPSINIPKNTINSNIVNYEDIIFLVNRLKEISPKIHKINFILVYRASEDGDRAMNFHQKCDKIGPNLVLIKTRKGNIFGGFTFKNWEHMPRDIDDKRPNLGSASRDSKAFGFNVNNQKIYNNEKPNEFAIWCNRNYGPTFKNNLFQIFDSCLKKGGYCSVKSNSHFGGQLSDFEIAGGESRFRVEELEVFEIRKN